MRSLSMLDCCGNSGRSGLLQDTSGAGLVEILSQIFLRVDDIPSEQQHRRKDGSNKKKSPYTGEFVRNFVDRFSQTGFQNRIEHRGEISTTHDILKGTCDCAG